MLDLNIKTGRLLASKIGNDIRSNLLLNGFFSKVLEKSIIFWLNTPSPVNGYYRSTLCLN
jgi:hypothetical protein